MFARAFGITLFFFAATQFNARAQDQCPCFTAEKALETCSSKKIEYSDKADKGYTWVELICEDRSFWIEVHTDGSSVCYVHNEDNFKILVSRDNLRRGQIDACFAALREAKSKLNP